jgi:hypothetical protein
VLSSIQEFTFAQLRVNPNKAQVRINDIGCSLPSGTRPVPRFDVVALDKFGNRQAAREGFPPVHVRNRRFSWPLVMGIIVSSLVVLPGASQAGPWSFVVGLCLPDRLDISKFPDADS